MHRLSGDYNCYGDMYRGGVFALGMGVEKTKEVGLEKIFFKEEKEFLRLWSDYHRKHHIGYTHDEANDFFVKLTLIFKEDK